MMKRLKIATINRIFFKIGPKLFHSRHEMRGSIFSQGFQKADVKKILLFRTGFIGDMVTFLPALKSLREGFQDAHISLVTSKEGKEIINSQDLVNEIIVCSGSDFLSQKRTEKIQFLKKIRTRRFDIVICSTQEKLVWFALIAFFSGAKFKVGFEDSEGYFLYNFVIPLDQQKTEIERNLDIIRNIGLSVRSNFPSLGISQENFTEIRKFLSKKGVQRDELLLGIHPFGKRPSRGWLKERYAKVADVFNGKNGIKVFFTGSKKDRNDIDEICGMMETKSINLAGELSISQLMALIKQCSLFLTVDTGPMHIAAALGTKTIALFGPGDFNKWTYKDPNFMAIKKDVHCSPCYNYVCDSHECMRAITVEEVIEKVHLTLGKIHVRP